MVVEIHTLHVLFVNDAHCHFKCWYTTLKNFVLQVDGSSIAGICFVGINDSSARIALLMTPLIVACAVMMIYLWRGIYRLLSVSLSSSDFISDKGRTELKSNATRVALFSLGFLATVTGSLIFQFRLMSAQPIWERSLREYI